MERRFSLKGLLGIPAPCLAALVVVTLSACTTTGFADFYEPWYEDNFFPESSYLKEGETPLVLKTYDLNSKFREVSSSWFWCIGNSGFNGPDLDDPEITKALSNLCKDKGAVVAIYSKAYTDTRSGVYSMPHTNYHYYTDAYGYRKSYTTTSYNTSSYSIQRYDFSAYLFVPIPDEYKTMYIPGFSVGDLTQQDKDKYKQNTGCMVNIVYQDSEAYYANLVHGDIITEINGTPIRSSDEFFEVKYNTSLGDVWNMTIVRDGEEKHLSLTFTL